MKVAMDRFLVLGVLALAPGLAEAQGTAADYQRAQEARQKYQGLATGIAGPATWIDDGRFWYRKSVKGGNEFVLVDAVSQTKKPAFDHDKFAAALSAVTGQRFSAIELPFTAIEFADAGQVIQVTAAGAARMEQPLKFARLGDILRL